MPLWESKVFLVQHPLKRGQSSRTRSYPGLCCLKQQCENFVILVNLKKQHWWSYCTLDLLVSRALLVQELFLLVLAAVECLLWYFSTSAGVWAWRALVKWVCNWNSFWGCCILFLSVLVAVMCSYCTAALQTGLCWPGTVSLYALKALGLVFLPTWFFRDASVVQTSHVTACPRATMCFAALWVWSNDGGGGGWGGGDAVSWMSIRNFPKALCPPFCFPTSVELYFSLLSENELWIWEGDKPIWVLSAVWHSNPACWWAALLPRSTAIWQVLLHNLSGQLYSNLFSLGVGLAVEETSFKATFFSIDTFENRIEGQFSLSVLLTWIWSW